MSSEYQTYAYGRRKMRMVVMNKQAFLPSQDVLHCS